MKSVICVFVPLWLRKCLECRKIVFAVGAFDRGLADGVVACGGEGFEATLVDWLAATRADPVTSFLDTQERLIDISNHLGTAFTKSQRDLFVQILHGEIHAVFDAIIVKLERRRLIGADLFGVLA